jgi:hypothetical protein
VLRSENGAGALRLLGQQDRLVWYVPTLDDLVADDGVSLATLLPDWLRPALWLLVITTLALLLWRARRLGALAPEPLPVVVKAIETTRSRGRLYRKSQDRRHAAAVLRAATLTRVARREDLGDGADPGEIARRLARQSGWPEAEVLALIGPDAAGPVSDRDLIELANRLSDLEEEARSR